MRLTTRQIARALGRDESLVRRRLAVWRREGVAIETSQTGGRPTQTVAVADVARLTGQTEADVIALAGV